MFLAELKIWSGEGSLAETIAQLRDRLTWRDSYGVAVVLSKNAGFSDVLIAIENAIPTLEGFVTASLTRVGDHHFAARFTIPSDPARNVTVHVLAYNLFLPKQEKRTHRTPKGGGTGVNR